MPPLLKPESPFKAPHPATHRTAWTPYSSIVPLPARQNTHARLPWLQDLHQGTLLIAAHRAAKKLVWQPGTPNRQIIAPPAPHRTRVVGQGYRLPTSFRGTLVNRDSTCLVARLLCSVVLVHLCRHNLSQRVIAVPGISPKS
jgi:hypothetical protein